MNLKTVLYVCIVLFVLSGAAGASTVLSNAGGGVWKYQKDIYVNENSGTKLTDYQVMVELKGSDFPAGAKNGGADIRFTNAVGVELSYWIEEWNSAGKTARIWVKVPEIPSDGEAKITMHYGNPSASNSGNGDATFDFFDDFDGTGLNADKWLVQRGPTVIVTGGKLNIGIQTVVGSAVSFSSPRIFESMVKLPGMKGEESKIIFSAQSIGPGGEQLGFDAKQSNEITRTMNPSEKVMNIVKYYNDEKVHTIKWRSKDVIFQHSYSTVATHTKPIPSNPLYIHFINMPDGPGFVTMVVDWARARKYAFPEPAVAIGPYIKKSASPRSISPQQESQITVYLKNYGSSDITNIEVADSIPANFDFVNGDFPASKKFDVIRPGEAKEMRYTIWSKETGEFKLEPVSVTYTDSSGNAQSAKSEPVQIDVSSNSEVGKAPGRTSTTSASVSLHGEKTEVVLGEDILLKLSAVNLINKPKMHLQAIIIPPSGMSVTSSEFSKSGAGQFTADYELAPGDGRDIEVRIQSNQVGDFTVNGRIVYYFGDNKGTSEDYILELPIKVLKENSSAQESTGKGTPGFEAVLGISGLLFAIFLIKKGE
ncbi:MAG: DUF2341 domain-containing protein [Euryarchaeota archaeon]|nr:DUF2341 domain-containing protein [Euryarchaeota archaeon]MBU4340163.1 DUF2341 domain-containing protein [Euryarchaeota archaeon]MCG2735307.1 DUF2341 domain-containing protein [Candidatus Methanoperedenaceae archaeon]